MSLPNIVRDATEQFASSEPVERYDVLKRGRLPMAVDWMELQWREHPLHIATRLMVANSQLALWLFLTFCICTFVVAPVSRVFGTGIFSPVTYPLTCFICGLVAYQRFARTASFGEAAWRFFLPQASLVFLECLFSPGIDRRFVVIPVGLAILAVGYLADQVNTHYVRWITANLRLKKEAVIRRRTTWDLRFDWIALSKQIAELEAAARSCEVSGSSEEAFGLRRRAGELGELREYPLGFLVLLYFSALLLLGASSTMLVSAGFALSVALAFRRPLITLKLARLITEVIIHAFVSWFSWDQKQTWVNSPGMFRDGLTSRFRRLTQTVGCFALLGLVFIPSIHLWGMGEIFTGGWLWKVEYEFFFNLLLPPVMLLCTLMATGGRPLWMNLEAVEWCELSEHFELTGTWDAAVGRLQGSTNRLEKEHVILGTHAEYGYPVIVPKQILNEHIQIVGGSGSGKTARILTPLITQLVRGGGSAVVIIDLKGDMALFEAVRLEAKKNGRVFKHFTNVLGRSSHLFNPMQQVNSPNTSISQFVETLMESLRLNYGDGYGGRFFSSQSRAWLLKTVKRFPNISSFEELYAKAAPEFFKNEAEMDRCREAISVIQQIAEVAALNWKPRQGQSDQPMKDAIFMPDVVRDCQVVYFWLPAIGETSTVKEIANLALYALMEAKKAHKEAGGNEQAYLVIDEVQRMASEGFKLILQQARSFGLSITVSNQSESDLMTKQANRLLDTIRTNTQVKLYLSVNDPLTIKMLEKASGLISYADIGGKLDYRPRQTVNDITFYSSHSDYCICWITRDSGFAAYGGEWFGLKTAFHIGVEEYERRNNANWLAPTEGTIVAKRTPEGSVTFQSGTDLAMSSGQFGLDVEEPLPLVVPEDSKWARRLNEVYSQKFVKGGNRDAV